LRCDKLILSALQTTVDLYLSGQALDEVPGVAMLRTPLNELQTRAAKIVAALEGLPVKAAVSSGKAQVGGGTLPQSVIESVVIALHPHSLPLEELSARLRAATPPIIGYIAGNKFRIDLRTVFARQDSELIRAIRKLFAHAP
jgi:L-seryl-tRNA(Ser) seleniumtransferase